jgi:hypothetical protein
MRYVGKDLNLISDLEIFLRSINGEDQKYKCVRNKDCLITRNTRTQCQFCRFQKCQIIGMTINGFRFLKIKSSIDFP